MLESKIFNYCIFFRDSRIEYGWIEKIQKNKAIVIPLQGKNQFLPENRLVFCWKDKKFPTNASIAHELIKNHINEANKFKNTCEIETMHSLLNDIREYSLDELSESFLNNPKNTIHKLGLFIALREDSFWFKKNRNLTYTPRTKKEIDLLKNQLFYEEKYREKSLNLRKWIKQLESGNWEKESEISKEHHTWITQLLDLLTEGSESAYWKEISKMLNLGSSFGIYEENKIKKWLSQAGFPVSWSKLILLRAKVKDFFSKKISKEINRIKTLPLAKSKIFNSNLPTYTIDSKNTLDYDDAFSVIEWNKNGIKIAIHITDLSYYIVKNDILFKEAESRISSVYTVEENYPMLPKELSNDIFSLKSGVYRNVLSFFFHLSIHGDWNLVNIDSRRIIVNQNLSYEEANNLIEDKKEFWGILDECCMQSQKKRIEKGALNISRKEFFIDISNPENIKITEQNRNSPANRVIEELAITVNNETGKLFQKCKFPGIYRTQSSYEILKEVENGVPFSMEDIRINPTKLSTIPDKHAGLGCEFYMQVTSPIRRFADLVTQIQLKLLLKKKIPIFSENEMISWSEEISTRQKKYKRAEIEILNYWKLLYIDQNIEETYTGKTKNKLTNGNIEIEILELDFTIATSGLKEYKQGEIISFKVNYVEKLPPKLRVKSLKK